jgi:hypothetical protein
VSITEAGAPAFGAAPVVAVPGAGGLGHDHDHRVDDPAAVSRGEAGEQIGDPVCGQGGGGRACG